MFSSQILHFEQTPKKMAQMQQHNFQFHESPCNNTHHPTLESSKTSLQVPSSSVTLSACQVPSSTTFMTPNFTFWLTTFDVVCNMLLQSPLNDSGRRWRVIPHLATFESTPYLANMIMLLINSHSIYAFKAQPAEIDKMKSDFAHLKRVVSIPSFSPQERYWLLDEHSLETLCGCNEPLLQQALFRLSGVATSFPPILYISAAFDPNQSSTTTTTLVPATNGQEKKCDVVADPLVEGDKPSSSTDIITPSKQPLSNRNSVRQVQWNDDEDDGARQSPKLVEEQGVDSSSVEVTRDDGQTRVTIKIPKQSLETQKSPIFYHLFKKLYPGKCWNCLIDHRGRDCEYHHFECQNCKQLGHATYACEELLFPRLLKQEKRAYSRKLRNTKKFGATTK